MHEHTVISSLLNYVKQCRACTCMKLLIFNNSLINNDVFGEVNRAWVHNGYYFCLLWKINLQRWLCQIWVRILDNVNFTYIIKIIYIVLHVHVYVVFIFNFRLVLYSYFFLCSGGCCSNYHMVNGSCRCEKFNEIYYQYLIIYS